VVATALTRRVVDLVRGQDPLLVRGTHDRPFPASWIWNIQSHGWAGGLLTGAPNPENLECCARFRKAHRMEGLETPVCARVSLEKTNMW